ncbi:hypothetical protein Franean1_1473 [Parafrankia sp. EAN1pec]|nr:hypothetical protein Franean1_1473 [Frankia sp. EAN1pec]
MRPVSRTSLRLHTVAVSHHNPSVHSCSIRPTAESRISCCSDPRGRGDSSPLHRVKCHHVAFSSYCRLSAGHPHCSSCSLMLKLRSSNPSCRGFASRGAGIFPAVVLLRSAFPTTRYIVGRRQGGDACRPRRPGSMFGSWPSSLDWRSHRDQDDHYHLHSRLDANPIHPCRKSCICGQRGTKLQL